MFDVIIIVLNFDCDNIIRENYDYYIYYIIQKGRLWVIIRENNFIQLHCDMCIQYTYKYNVYTLHVNMRYIVLDRRTLYIYLHII